MLQYFETLTDDSGNSLLGATVAVTNYPSGTPALIYNSNGTASPIGTSTVLSDITGQVSFYIPDGSYTLTYAFKATVYKVKSPVQMLDPMGFAAALDTGTAGAYVLNSSAYPQQLYTGLKVQLTVANSSPRAATFNLNGSGNVPIVLPGGAAVQGGQIIAAGIYTLQYDGANWELGNPNPIPPAIGISPFAYGAVGDGATDDTTAVQLALNAAAGGVLYLPTLTPNGAAKAKFLVGNITVPLNTSIVGGLLYPTLLIEPGGLQVNPYNLGSQIRTKAGATITLNDGAALENLLIIHAGLSLPATTNAQATTLVAQFADIAVTAPQASIRMERCMVLGYNYFCQVTNSGGTNLSSRTMIRDCMGDNNNGPFITSSADVSHVSGCHMFPFLTFGITGVSDANLQRPGTAYYFQNVDDWFTVFDCFSFAYAVGYECVDTSAVAFLRCQADYTATGGGTNAFLVTYSASHTDYCSIVDCQAIGYSHPCLVNPGPASPTGNDTVQLIGNKFIYASGGVGIEASSGFPIMTGNLIQGVGTGIQLDSGVTGASIQNNRIVSAVTPIANATSAAVVTQNNPGYNPVGTSQSTHLVGASPYTYTAGTSSETLYAFCTSITEIAINGVSILAGSTAATVTLELGPNEQAVFFYTGTLTISTDKH